MRQYLPATLKRLKTAAREAMGVRKPRSLRANRGSTARLIVSLIIFVAGVIFLIFVPQSPLKRGAILAWILTGWTLVLGGKIATLWTNGLNLYPFHLFPVSMEQIFRFFGRRIGKLALHSVWIVLLAGILASPQFRPDWQTALVALVAGPVLILSVAILVRNWTQWLYCCLLFPGIGVLSQEKAENTIVPNILLNYTPGGLLIKPFCEVEPAEPLRFLLLGVTILAAMVAWRVCGRMRTRFHELEQPVAPRYGTDSIDLAEINDLVAPRATGESFVAARNGRSAETIDHEFLHVAKPPRLDAWLRSAFFSKEKRLLSIICRADYFTRTVKLSLWIGAIAIAVGIVTAFSGKVAHAWWIAAVALIQVVLNITPATGAFARLPIGTRMAPLVALFPISPVGAMWLGLKLKFVAALIKALIFGPILFGGLLAYGIPPASAAFATYFAVVLALATGITVDASMPWTQVRPSFSFRGCVLTLFVCFAVILYIFAIFGFIGVAIGIATEPRVPMQSFDPTVLLIGAVLIFPSIVHFLASVYFLSRMWWDLLYLPSSDKV